MQRRLAAAALLVLAVALLACGDDDSPAPVPAGEGQPRPFAMGLSALPAEPGDQAFRDAFDLADEAGEVVLIQRPPPWADFLPGASISEQTKRLTRFEKELARENNLRRFLAPAAAGVGVAWSAGRPAARPFRKFVSRSFEAYDAAKAVSPDPLVFPVFQY